jgi:hypothetical protein
MEQVQLLSILEQAMDLIVDDRPDAAIATLWRVRRELKDINFAIDMPSSVVFAGEIRYEAPAIVSRQSIPVLSEDTFKREAEKAKDRERKRLAREKAHAVANGLPPIKPINGSVKPTKSSEIPCPKCGAKPGMPCTGYTTAGKWGKPTGEPIKTFHTGRIRKAQQMTQERQRKATLARDLIDQAAEAEKAS